MFFKDDYLISESFKNFFCVMISKGNCGVYLGLGEKKIDFKISELVESKILYF